jgi:hypothetical protein
MFFKEFIFVFKKVFQDGVVAHACNTSTLEAEAGGLSLRPSWKQPPVAHTCNLSYSGVSDRKDSS